CLGRSTCTWSRTTRPAPRATRSSRTGGRARCSRSAARPRGGPWEWPGCHCSPPPSATAPIASPSPATSRSACRRPWLSRWRGGVRPPAPSALAAFLLPICFSPPPLHTWTIDDHENVLALAVFVGVAAIVSGIVDLAGRRTREAARGHAQAEVLSTMAGHVLRGDSALPTLLERMRETFGLISVAVLERRGDPSPDDSADPDAWNTVACTGADPCPAPGSADIDVRIDDRLVLAARGRPLAAADRVVLEAFAAEAAVVLRQQRL